MLLLFSIYSLYYSRQVFSDRDVLHPHTGQTVAVKYSTDQQWYRGQVMQCTETSVQVILDRVGLQGLLIVLFLKWCISKYLLSLPFAVEVCAAD